MAKAIEAWAHGRDPEEYGWIVEGRPISAYEVDEIAERDGIEALKEEGFPDAVVERMKESCSFEAGRVYSPSAWLQDNA